jgi:hypothetical protein
MAGRGRTGADEALAANLAGGMTTAQAAAKAGVAERTARRRLKDPEFCQLVQRLKTEAVNRAIAILGRSMSGASGVLVRLLSSADERIQLQAAREIIGLGLKARQSEELERRVADLERMLTEGEDGDTGGASEATGSAGGPPAAGPGTPDA